MLHERGLAVVDSAASEEELSAARGKWREDFRN